MIHNTSSLLAAGAGALKITQLGASYLISEVFFEKKKKKRKEGAQREINREQGGNTRHTKAGNAQR